MIQVTALPRVLEVNLATELEVCLTNDSNTACSGVICKLKLPPEIFLLGGMDRIEMRHLAPGESGTFRLLIKPSQVGSWAISSSNFSYRDAHGQGRRITDLRLPIKVAPAGQTKAQPVPAKAELEVDLGRSSLPLREWASLAGVVKNVGKVSVGIVAVRALGPITYDNKNLEGSLGTIDPGEGTAFRISVRAEEAGQEVPIYTEVEYLCAGQEGYCRKFTPMNVSTKEPAGTTKILFLSSEPTDVSQVRSGEECREIREKLRIGTDRDRFSLVLRTAVRNDDLSGALLEERPEIVHFSGHGTGFGLCLEDRFGRAHEVDKDALAQLFKLASSYVNCVVLSACFSEKQAREIARHIKYVIGMDRAISASAAVAFAVGFYRALGEGCSIPEAHQFGCVQVMLEGIEDFPAPILFPEIEPD